MQVGEDMNANRSVTLPKSGQCIVSIAAMLLSVSPAWVKAAHTIERLRSLKGRSSLERWEGDISR